MELTEATIQILLGLVLPLVVGLITKYTARDGVKVVIGIIVAGIVSTIQQAMIDGGGAVLTEEHFIDFILIYGAQVLAYLGVYRPVDANDHLAPSFGIGGDRHSTP